MRTKNERNHTKLKTISQNWIQSHEMKTTVNKLKNNLILLKQIKEIVDWKEIVNVKHSYTVNYGLTKRSRPKTGPETIIHKLKYQLL